MDPKQLKEILDTYGEYVEVPLRGRAVEPIYRWQPKSVEQSCPDCDNTVVDRKIHYKLIFIDSGIRFEKKCSKCPRYFSRLKDIS